MQLKAEWDILKKVRGFLRKRVDVRFAFIAKHLGIWPMRWMCEVLYVSRGGFYDWLTRPQPKRNLDNERPMRRVVLKTRHSRRGEMHRE